MDVRLRGYCLLSPAEIRSRIESGASLRDLSGVPGNFVITVKDAERNAVISSDGFAGQYFYAVTNDGFFHGPSVSGVLQDSGLPRSWNFRAMADYLSLGHVIGTETLMHGVECIPQGTVAEWKGGRVQFSKNERKQARRGSGGDVQGAIDALCSDVMRWWNGKAILCITGGLDSRLLLAVLLAHDIKPDLYVAGQAGSFDVEVAQQIARSLGLSLHREEVIAEDFIEHADAISNATNGMLPMSHWPGSLLAAKAPKGTLVVGLNGEYARSYYFDRGCVSMMLDRVSLPIIKRNLFEYRLGFPASPLELRHLHPELAAEYTASNIRARLRAIFREGEPLGPSLDEAYKSNYGANKTGADLSAIGAFRPFVAPLFSPDWIDAVRDLPRHWKVNSYFHRFAIHKLCPALLNLPEVCAGRRCAKTVLHARPFYWLARQRYEVKSFFDQTVYDDPRLSEFVRPRLDAIADIVEPAFLERAHTDVQIRQLRFSFATVAMWYKQVLMNQ